VLNLDGGVVLQKNLVKKYQPEVIDMTEWGPAMRMECYWYTLNGFEQALTRNIGTKAIVLPTDLLGTKYDDDPEGRPLITFFGSNDFHHVSLPLIRRWHQPFNVVSQLRRKARADSRYYLITTPTGSQTFMSGYIVDVGLTMSSNFPLQNMVFILVGILIPNGPMKIVALTLGTS
jgi:hypothetical protein